MHAIFQSGSLSSGSSQIHLTLNGQSCLFRSILDSGLNYFSISNLRITFHLFTRFNTSMQRFFMGKSKKNVANGNAAASSEMEDGNASYVYLWDDDPSSPLLATGKVNQTGRAPQKPFCCQQIVRSGRLWFFLSLSDAVALISTNSCWTNWSCFGLYCFLLIFS